MEHMYCALIVDRDLEHRARLRLAMRASLLFPTVHVANSLQEAELHLSEEPIDIVFIAMREDEEAINRFIKRLKQELAGRDAAYVLLLEGRRSSVEIARTLVDGADALLLEPYSVESLHTISRLAETMKKERSRVVACKRACNGLCTIRATFAWRHTGYELRSSVTSSRRPGSKP